MKLALEIINREIAQRKLANKHNHLRKEICIKEIEELESVVNLLSIPIVSSSFNLEIKDKDIATIEALHDVLLDEKILGLNARCMKESRALTQRMYKALSKD